MDIKTVYKKISDISENRGQITGLPSNPRKITKKSLEKLKKSITDNPEMLDLREIIVYKDVIIAGNMRYKACVALGVENVLCKVLPDDTPVSVLKAITMKDNIPFGDWDIEAIKIDWSFDEVIDFGFDIKELKFHPDKELSYLDYSKKENKKNEDSEMKSLVFILNKEQYKLWNKKKQLIGLQDDMKVFMRLIND